MVDNFEKGIYWGLYKDYESQFLDYLEYVPYFKDNEKTYSFKLLNLILGIGGYIDSILKEMAYFHKFQDNDGCIDIISRMEENITRLKEHKSPKTIPIRLLFDTFGDIYSLSKINIHFKTFQEEYEIQPFTPDNPSTNIPKWWRIYNGLKHDLSNNIKEANLVNARDSLSCTFVLNAIHIPSYAMLISDNIIKRRRYDPYGHASEKITKEKLYEAIYKVYDDKKKMLGVLESSIFYIKLEEVSEKIFS